MTFEEIIVVYQEYVHVKQNYGHVNSATTQRAYTPS